MILLDTILRTAINPALAMLPPKMDSKEARVQMLTIGLQESEFMTRIQHGRGPAHSYWQMERGGGILGVLTHSASKFLARDICRARRVEDTSHGVWERMLEDDVLGAAFARLLLLTDPLRLPAITDTAGAWALYERVWKPGKPHPEKWAAYHAQARAQVLS